MLPKYLAGETLHALAKRHDLSRNLIRIWVQKYEAGALDEDVAAAECAEYEARIAALERLVGEQALEIEFQKGALKNATAAEKRDYIRDHRPPGVSIARRMPADGTARAPPTTTRRTARAATAIVARDRGDLR